MSNSYLNYVIGLNGALQLECLAIGKCIETLPIYAKINVFDFQMCRLGLAQAKVWVVVRKEGRPAYF